MSSNAKKRQTMAKMTRERTLRERREQKQQKKDGKKQAALAAAAGETVDDSIPAPTE